MTDRRQVAFAHLSFKLNNPVDRLMSLGLLNAEEVYDKVLMRIYPVEDVEYAAFECVKYRLLDLYYSIKCDKCSHVSIYKESKYPHTETLKLISTQGEACQGCGHTVFCSKSLNEVDKYFAISENSMENLKESNEVNSFSILNKIRNIGAKK
jgi:hypothetical protein